jgi:hypothetical protein
VTLVDATALTAEIPPTSAPRALGKWEVPVPDLDGADSVKPGHLVLVDPPAPSEEEEEVPDARLKAIVLEEVPAEKPQLLVLYCTGGTEEVALSRCSRVLPPRPASQTVDKSLKFVGRAEALLGTAFTNPRALARAAQPNDQGVRVVQGASVELPKFEEVPPPAPAALPDIEEVRYEPLPPDYVCGMMRTLGRASQRLNASDRVLAQNIAAAVLGEIMQSRTVFTGHFAERYAPRIGQDERPHHRLCGPALALLESLAEIGVLKAAEKPLRFKNGALDESGIQLAYTAWDPCVPALAVALRLLQLRESRCVYYVPEAEGTSNPSEPASRPETPEFPDAFPDAPSDALAEVLPDSE